MPGRNVVKQYIEGGYYHVYNRGVEKRPIFMDQLDYEVFIMCLRQMVSPPIESSRRSAPSSKNYHKSVELICYCLMPNHFHLLLRQREATDMTNFMRSLGTAYTMYFNKRYERVGRLFQGIYKAVSIVSDEQLIQTSRYIHLNPKDLVGSVEGYEFSSLQNYLIGDGNGWLNIKPVLQNFQSPSAYADFVRFEDQLAVIET